MEKSVEPSVSLAARPHALIAPLISLHFTQRYCDCRLLALADEEGCLSVVETGGAPLPSGLYGAGGVGGGGALATARPRAQWLCHNNAVFDLAWARVRE